MHKMSTVAHFHAEFATEEDAKQAEELMRNPHYVEAVLGAVNSIARMHAKLHGFSSAFTIVGDIHEVTHTHHE